MIKKPRYHRNHRPQQQRSTDGNLSLMTMPSFNDNNTDERLDYRPQRSRAFLQQQVDKNMNQAREAMGSGDRVLAEYYLQHVDHFNRLMNEQKDQHHHKSHEPKKSPLPTAHPVKMETPSLSLEDDADKIASSSQEEISSKASFEEPSSHSSTEDMQPKKKIRRRKPTLSPNETE